MSLLYETTCFIDKNYEFSGVMLLENGYVIDFDRRTILHSGKDLKISSTYMNLLEKLILESPHVVKYETLFEIYYGERYYTVDVTDMQVLRNFKTRVDKYIEVENVSRQGYYVSLKKKIKRFPDLCREDVTDISALFNTNDQLKTEKSTIVNRTHLDFSRDFFHDGAKRLVSATGEDVMGTLRGLSSVFEKITVTSGIENNKDVLTSAYDCIIKGCKSEETELLKIKGPLGSYKNRIMQYLYLAVEKNNADILPFYIDLAAYEKNAEADILLTEKVFTSQFENNMDEIEGIIGAAKDKKPLLFLDGVRDFTCGKESFYYTVKEKLRKLGCKVIICLDSDFTVNKQYCFKLHPLASNDFTGYIRLSSMSLYRKADSLEFIKNCISFFEIEMPEDITAEIVYDSLIRLNFVYIDAYWLVYILNTSLSDIVNPNNTISDIYGSFCLSALKNGEEVDTAADIAYDFEFGAVDFNKIDPFFDSRWRLIRKHRSVLEFLVAKRYVRNIAELKLKGEPINDTVKKLSFFNSVLPKSITRFVNPMMCGIDEYEHRIMIIANKYYDELSLFGKSELTFWMGRLKNPVRKGECMSLLKEFHKKEMKRYLDLSSNETREKRDLAFLIRGINVSLIYGGDREAFSYYLGSLVHDKIANSVNRGFHLEYYGDKPYVPNKTLLDFEDNTEKGRNTMDIICLSLDRRLKNHVQIPFVAALEVMTLCNLIQARLEKANSAKTMDISSYVGKCQKYLEWILGQRFIKNVDSAQMYFTWMRDELNRLIADNKNKTKKLSYHPSYLINKFSDAEKIERAGWVERDIPCPENVAEHMYGCWLIGMLYLPNSYLAEDYDKNTVLQMLLIHDLGETETGDISRPQKLERQQYFDARESLVMQGLLLSGTYPSSVDQTSYLENWKGWEARRDINAKIARDIDNIQTLFRFCKYFIEYPDILDKNQIYYWLSGLFEIETEIGKEIAEIVIRGNPRFKEIIELFDSAF